MVSPIDDAIKVLLFLKQNCPDIDKMWRHGRLELTFKDGVVYSVGPLPYLLRGKDFRVDNSLHVSTLVIDGHNEM